MPLAVLLAAAEKRGRRSGASGAAGHHHAVRRRGGREGGLRAHRRVAGEDRGVRQAPPSRAQRKADTLALLRAEVDCWVASADEMGNAHLVPLSHWAPAVAERRRSKLDARLTGKLRLATAWIAPRRSPGSSPARSILGSGLLLGGFRFGGHRRTGQRSPLNRGLVPVSRGRAPRGLACTPRGLFCLAATCASALR